ncbi:DoxX family protein [Streptomyces sp. NPDC093586]|uniref:DoxX family protein n=1 Tax=Streptomyces sp. NPDC093586 TaxID=3366042 RepID=UPI0037FAA401
MPAPRSTALRDVLGIAPAHRFPAVAPCVVRVTAGAVVAVHGLDKLVDGPAAFGVHLASLGVPAPDAVGWAVALGETAGGLLLTVGLLSRLVSVLLSLHLFGAIALVNADTGFMTPQQGQATGAGAEFPVLLVAGLAVVVLAGPGPFALDRVVGLERGAAGLSSPAAAFSPPAPATFSSLSVMAGAAPSAATPDTPRVPVRPAVRATLTSGAIGGVIGAVMSALANHLVVGMPASAGANAANHAVSGLISGFLAGFLGLLTYRCKHDRHTGPGTPQAHPVATPPVTEI